ncbi:hypothetical protein HPP92_024434 [Vanilla planifolia]|uniref:Uncharacterized protein n=1 Tax=Vanilla planifolia TaxID=51239 RepID=A0A835UBT1_VANPL|nr:hypothetical protein HPP92_024745 [Vanilla planifolia]KAG0456646.1 hypothetical protein HPP92_024434 [Vanilla planifolia]
MKAVQEEGEIKVNAFISRDQLVAKCDSRNKPTLLKPEYRTEATGEEDSIDMCKAKRHPANAFQMCRSIERPPTLLAT